MPKEHLSLSKSNLAFAKLSATPTEKAWSQAYNAGNLFACLSLNSEGGEELHALQTLGKDLFSNLEAEFFTLEEKNLETITEAIQKSTKHIPDTISIDFCLAYFKDSVLYIFILGGGRVIMKRGEKTGILLEKAQDKTLQTASGYLQNEDVVILETSRFAHNVSDKNLTDSLQLNLPSDIAESLSVHMHESTDGDQAAIIVVFHGITQPVFDEVTDGEEETLEDIKIKEESLSPPDEPRTAMHLPSLPNLPHLPSLRHLHLNHRKRFFLSITILILAILVISVVLTKQKQENSERLKLFESIYTQALSNYEEGVELKSLNPGLSSKDLQEAEKLLTDGKNTFAENSEEDKKIEDLLAKVQSELKSSTNQTQAKEITLDKNNILSLEKANPKGTGFGQNEENVFFATEDAIISINKKSGTKKDLIENDNDWDNALSIVPFQANVYLLDKDNSVLKFVPSNDGYSNNNYFTDEVDLSKATSMTIDGSIWILFNDGTISKYLKGQKEAFAIKNLDKPMSSPTKLFTDADTKSLYILDRGNSRIVQIGKDGAFQKQFSADILKNAKDFEVLEADKKIHVLSGDKIWEIPM